MKTKYKWVACWWDCDEKMWVPSSDIKINKNSCRGFIEEQKADGCIDTKWMIAKVELKEGDVIE